ncbi:cytochrome c oxidase assembly factor 1 homolog isoform X1 [Lagenorhynchus albirostris]|uniref:cytochrome c oxidase assembly factor 1 homolog isoform X1 n=1 Tax=Lagenorhynchus albirostris TaxID=27610 RepID=UPI0028F04453|nr:cytochrome c oxidase assembly factor 1 homolog isoform X1 [Lagenorhynchus albirostris]XP_060013344.1 cytochrome c oxidase assembly factor 1 homolog isoform X1 [Lagenorhynchus albirostris]
MVVMNSSFCLPGSILIFLSFLKDNFASVLELLCWTLQLHKSTLLGQLYFDDFQGSWATKWQKSLGSRMSVPLGKQLFFTGVAASGGCALLYYLIQKTFSRASYYQLALEHLHSHPEALEALGTPLNVHYLRLTDKYNFVDIADAKLKIPVSGPKSEGYLYVTSSRDAPFKRWNLQEVFLELKDGQQIPLFKPSGENSNELKKE